MPARQILLGSIPDAYILRLQGRPYVTHKGLVAMAHQHGIVEVTTEIVSWEPESRSAVVRASTVGERGRYTGMGDACPQNVSKQLASACLRMAETRAINRALRLYLGIGICSVDELPGNDEPKAAEPRQWTADEQRRFTAEADKLGVSVEQIASYCASINRPHPAEMAPHRRMALISYLSEDGFGALQAHIDGISDDG
jgi:hypothetical protein|tara:strand:- start:400 stop:993 length:594 start_codon:yes stop_codon:yes gene_type:complete